MQYYKREIWFCAFRSYHHHLMKFIVRAPKGHQHKSSPLVSLQLSLSYYCLSSLLLFLSKQTGKDRRSEQKFPSRPFVEMFEQVLWISPIIQPNRLGCWTGQPCDTLQTSLHPSHQTQGPRYCQKKLHTHKLSTKNFQNHLNWEKRFSQKKKFDPCPILE